MLSDYKYISPDVKVDRRYFAGKGEGFIGTVNAYYNKSERNQFLNYKIDLPNEYLAEMHELLYFIRFQFSSIEVIKSRCINKQRLISSKPFPEWGYHYDKGDYSFYCRVIPHVGNNFRIFVYKRGVFSDTA